MREASNEHEQKVKSIAVNEPWVEQKCVGVPGVLNRKRSECTKRLLSSILPR